MEHESVGTESVCALPLSHSPHGPREKRMNPTEKFAQYRNGDPDAAKFFWNGGPVEMAPRTWFASLFSWLTAFETDEGVVLVDCGTAQLGDYLRQKIRQHTSARLHTVIYTHGHL